MPYVFTANDCNGKLPITASDGGAIGTEIVPVAAKKPGLKHVERLVHTHNPTHDTLFPHAPALKDINQQQIGDCWLLAALAAVLASNDGVETVLYMMRDLGAVDWRGGRHLVCVRLYNHLSQPQIFHVEKSVIDAEWHSQGPLWVKLLEKAATVLARDGKLQSETAFYGNISGGNTARAFRALTGLETDTTVLRQFKTVDFTPLPANPGVPVTNSVLKFWFGLMVGALLDVDPEDLNVFASKTAVVAQQKAYLKEWNDWAIHHNIRQVVADKMKEQSQRQLSNGLFSKTDYPGVFRFDDFLKLLQGKTPPLLSPAVAAAVADWVRDNQIFPGKIGTPLYSSTELHIFKMIDDAFKANKPATLSTYKYIGKKPQSFGSSGGEMVKDGLAGSHAYAVLGTSEAPSGHRFVKVFNPWGTATRQYKHLDHLQLSSLNSPMTDYYDGYMSFASSYKGARGDDADGIYWLDLHDVYKRCEVITICQGSPAPLRTPI